jgi:hypothetical protein
MVMGAGVAVRVLVVMDAGSSMVMAKRAVQLLHHL